VFTSSKNVNDQDLEGTDKGEFQSTIISFKPVQPKKADSPIVITELGIVMEVSPVQPEKARQPMDVTELGIVMEVSAVQRKKADSSIVVTDLGITNVVPLFLAG